MTVTKIEFTDKEVTAHGGIILLQKMLEQMKFTHFLERTPLPQSGSNRGYDPVQIFCSSLFLFGVELIGTSIWKWPVSMVFYNSYSAGNAWRDIGPL